MVSCTIIIIIVVARAMVPVVVRRGATPKQWRTALDATPTSFAAALAQRSVDSKTKNNTAVTDVVSPPEVFVANDGQARQLFDNGVVLPLGWTGASVRRRTGARLSPASGLQGSSWPVGDPSANPQEISLFTRKDWLVGIKDDLKRRTKVYGSDWTDGFRSPGKTIGAIAFLYFAVLAPAVAFGGVMNQATQGALGPREVITSCGLSGMAYALISGQPMTFVAPTGLTLAFIGALSAWTQRAGVPFAPMYAWCGLWTSAILILLASFNAPGLLRYCTRFTEDVFNALLAFNFIAEGATPVLNLLLSAAASSTTMASDALLAMNAALFTALACRRFAGATRARYFTARARSLVADFGPAIVIIAMSALLGSKSARRLGTLARLELHPAGAAGAAGASRRVFDLVDLSLLAVPYRLVAIVPAVFLAMLFFLDHNITVRTVNSPSNKLVKGVAYHHDLAALGLVTACASLLGLPWMCSATVQSLNHVRALSTYRDVDDVSAQPPAAALVTPPKPQSQDEPFAAKPPPKPLPSPAAIIEKAKEDAKLSVLNSSLAANPPPPPRENMVASKLGSANVSAASDFSLRPANPNASSFSASSVNSTRPTNGKNETAPVTKMAGGATAVALLQKEQELSSRAAAGAASSSKILAGYGGSEVSSVVETRLTGLVVHLCVLASLAAAPVLSEVPLAVVWGVFLFLGSKVIVGNQFVGRSKALFLDTKRLDPSEPTERVILELGRKPVLRYTGVQAACLVGLWLLKLNKATAMIFPSVIGVLLYLRASVLPKIFATRDLLTLDTELDL
ncbi:hypothetical protein CTAYLR_007749 [Chrysophaeum taylorii]|uniref:Bicarbonate transporter-like transmembrane domain-containing protein n=1 Tax=Chrysophaeum taylorii TaxID=2483200 RepID=A0AAD7UB10_9STRA|nr:hypothetical protein CTAYLR_007749 [Chrysophaeum taylorii]